MEKTTTINLGGFAFMIEEKAYLKLKNYLESVREKLSSHDKSEVMTDIEMGIAEKLKAKTTQDKEVITESDVEELIEVMGHPEDFDDSEDVEVKIKETPKKKLFRSTDDVIIGGVCSGLATYFNIEPVLVRLVAFLSIFCNGIGIPAYIILWVIIPAAETKSQKLAMQGDPLTVASIEKAYKESEVEEKKGFAKSLSNLGKVVKRLFSLCISLFLFFVHFCIISSCLAVIIGMTIFIVVMTMYSGSGYMIDDILISEIVKTMPFYLFLVSLFFATVIPAFLLLAADSMVLFKRKIVNFKAVIVLIVCWMIASISTTAIIIRYAPDLKAKMNDVEYRQTVEIPSLANFTNISASGKDLIVSIKQGEKFSVFANGMSVDLDRVSYSVDDKKTLNISIEEKIISKKCLFCDSKIVRVAVTAPNVTNIKLNGSDLNIDQIEGNKLTIEANNSDLAKLNGSINNLELKAIDSNVVLAGNFGETNLDINGSTLDTDIRSTKTLITLNKCRAEMSGYSDKTIFNLDNESRINGLDFESFNAETNIKNDSWVIAKFGNNLSMKVDETSGIFYIGGNVLSNSNSPFANTVKVIQVTPSEYRSNQNKDDYFEFYGKKYRIDLEKVDAETYHEKRRLLIEKF